MAGEARPTWRSERNGWEGEGEGGDATSGLPLTGVLTIQHVAGHHVFPRCGNEA